MEKDNMIDSINLSLQDGPAYEEPATKTRRCYMFRALEPVLIWLLLADSEAVAQESTDIM